MTARPWELVHRGQVRAAGWVLDPAQIGEEACRRRVVEDWRAGDRLRVLGDRWLLTFGSPRLVGPIAPGMPLVVRGDALIGCPLRDAEWLARPPGLVLIPRGGVLVGQDPGAELDPSAWIAAPSAVASVRSLAPPVVPPVAGLGAVVVDRGAFGVSAEAGTAASLQALLLGTPAPEGAAPLAPPAPVLPTWASRALSWLGGGTAGAPGADAPPAPGGQPAGGEGPGAFPGLGAFLERMLVRGMQGFGLGAAVEQRQATALSELLERFGGDIEEALRHAIPLGGGSGSGLSGTHPALRLPPPRPHLAPSLGGGGTGSGPSFGAASTLYDALKEAYRAAAERLEAEGQFEKAAFVHADLLRDVTAAVDLLDRHERWGLAARLWESRGSTHPERAIRWYFLAGEVPRAVRLAQATQRFAAAVELLAGDVPRQRGLRAVWAAHLVAAGRPAAAVDAVWPDPALRRAAVPWLRTVVGGGGPAGASALARWASVDLPGAQEAFDAPRVDGVAFRAALAVTLGTAGGPAGWTRPLARSLLIDGDPSGAEGFRRLTERPDLADLRADAPRFPPASTGIVRGQTLEGPAGTAPIEDVVAMPTGLLCALGHAGLAFIDLGGQVVWRDPTPAQHLVVDPDGFLVLALDRLGSAVRVGRVEIGARAVIPWARLELVAWAPTCLAGRWVVSDRERDLVLDLTSAEVSWLWRGPPREGRGVRGIDVGEGVTLARTDPDELWRYDDAMIYRGRNTCEGGAPFVLRGSDALALTPGAGPVWTHAGASRVLDPGVYDGVPRELALTAQRAVVARPGPAGVRVGLRDPGGQEVAGLDVKGASRVRMRAWADRLLLFDDLGRVWELDAGTLTVLRQGRV